MTTKAERVRAMNRSQLLDLIKSGKARGVNLWGVNLREAGLAGADFRKAILTVSDFSSAQLPGANLKYANLEGANLHNANLKGANLLGANLKGADLSYSDLTGAILTNAILSYADLTDALLSGASFREAVTINTKGLPILEEKKLRPTWNTNVQWKGTDLCMDFYCPECWHRSHFDGISFGFIRCYKCDTNFQLKTEIKFTETKTYGVALVGEEY
jgi:uncharacterized protein YjbI with pentapeptide repeats